MTNPHFVGPHLPTNGPELRVSPGQLQREVTREILALPESFTDHQRGELLRRFRLAVDDLVVAP